MPESDPPDSVVVEREIAALEGGVSRLIKELRELRQRTSEAESRHQQLEETLRRSSVDAGDPASLERRLRELSEENSRLREILREAKTRAKRIRNRLVVMEDERSP